MNDVGLQPLHIIYFGIACVAILCALKLHDKYLSWKSHRKAHRTRNPQPKIDPDDLLR